MEKRIASRKITSRSMWKRECKDVASCSYRYVLNAIDRVSHRRGIYRLSRIEVPKRMARGCINRLQCARIVSEENQPACGCECSAPGVTATHLGIAPGHFPIRT